MMTVIQATHLKFNYGSQQVLKDIDFTVEKGEIIGLIGENGAGKSTLLNILLGLLPAHGAATVLDRKPGTAFNKAHLGSMLQGDMVLSGITVLEMLQEAAAQYPKALDPLTVLAEIGLQAQGNQRITNLSGGQLRRVTFGMALVGNPDLLFLDEPTAGMDAKARQDFWQHIETLRQQGKTMIITSHYLEEIQQIADRLLILQDGRFTFQGTLDELQAQHLETVITCQTQLQPAIFKGLPAVTGVQQTGPLLKIHSTDGDLTLKALVPLLDQLHQISVTRKSLEDIFIQMTGK
ncbi:MAG: ABC transporter ATP-binding protein [Lactobacillus sp.]|jgi:ABC-2 type transport system ATP-binding protein|nr:ABC transporter ATP-binding protein [Lactobacillus sp.]